MRSTGGKQHLAAPNMHKSCQLLVQICNLHLLVWDLKSGQNLALRLQREDIGNAFQKKTQKTPKQELEKALKIMEEYQDEFKK